MKKYSIFILSTFIGVFIFTAIGASATTGGPTLIYDIRYDEASNKSYFQSISQDGRGCPAELHSLALNNNQFSTVFSCDDAEKLAQADKDYTFGLHSQKVYSFVEKFTTAKLVNLKTNKISIQTKATKVKTCTENNPFECGTDFVASVFQDGVKKADIPFSACSADETLAVDGYSINDSKGTIILLFSRIGICNEGGYILESIHPISEISISDTTTINYYKYISPLIPHKGSLFVSPGETEKMPLSAATNDNQASGSTIREPMVDDLSKNIVFVLAGAFLLGIGVILGKFLKN